MPIHENSNSEQYFQSNGRLYDSLNRSSIDRESYKRSFIALYSSSEQVTNSHRTADEQS
jgi:hypothetical protein